MARSNVFWGMALILFAAISIEVVGAGFGSTLGGQSEEKPADAEIKAVVKKVCEELKKKILAKVEADKGKKPDGKITELVPVLYKTQIVSGTNYCVKLRITCDKTGVHFYHAKIHEALSKKLEIIEVNGPKDEKDAL